MKDGDFFRDWLVLKLELSSSTAGSRLSSCRTVEKYEGDLDYHFDQDGLSSLLQRLAYSREDERLDQPPRHQIPITGNIYKRTATLRNAVSLYKEFRDLGYGQTDWLETISAERLGDWRKRLMKLLLAWEKKNRPRKGSDVATRIKHLELKGIISEDTGRSFREVLEQCNVGEHERKRLGDVEIFILKARWAVLCEVNHHNGIHCLCGGL